MKFIRKDSFKKLEESAFNSFDGDGRRNSFDSESNLFDPPAAGAPAAAAKPAVVKAQSSFDLSFINPTAQSITFEIFNELNSFLKKIRLDFVVGAYLYVPYTSLEGLALAGVGIVGFDQTGSLKITGNAVPSASLVCQQFPYSGLLESSGSDPFTITDIRQKSIADPQIDQQITHFQSSFLGSSATNVVSPRQYFNPNQQQPTLVDIPVNFYIDSTRGLKYIVVAGETVKWNVKIIRSKSM